MRYAIIENGKVVNVAKADTPIADNWIELTDGFGIGDLYEGGVFSKPPVDLLELESQAKSALSEALSSKWDQIKNGYPAYETATFAFQVEEAKAYLADNTAETPFIDAARGETSIADYCALVMSNNAIYKQAGGTIVAMRRTFESQIEACTTEAEYLAVMEAIQNA